MNWKTLYTSKRLGAEKRYETEKNDLIRNAYLRDYDRLIFSSPFRRMQNKTQVFPVPGPIFVHNRLTHSLEVASVGRSLGKAVGVKISQKYPEENPDFHEFYRHDLPTVVATACLAHDIGNPPFGHSGESAIRNYFDNLSGDTKDTLEGELSDNQLNDFRKFEGNANAFRILTNDQNGHQLTYTAIASIVKYPTDSSNGFDKGTGLIGTKKSGFFDSEIETYRKVADELQIKVIDEERNTYARHPFVFLMEAADDICYRIIDLEDAHRLRILTVQQVIDLLLPFWEEDEKTYNYLKNDKLHRIGDNNEKLSFLRAMLINLLSQKCTEAFMQHETQILAGQLNKSLIDILDAHTLKCLKKVDEISVKDIYNHKSVIEIEIAGYNVIGALLDEFLTAVLHPTRPKSGKLLQLIPKQANIKQGELYNNIQIVVDFVAGMSDLYAVDLYRRITGITIH
ncbi:MAG: deoxyguanosinetriphosphate triphosphohydrolase [Arcicella sp.]|jgi:dGTPase|nr:deoxyguanosinetriphosphate triphosphohydrolase [Arcicella sp.]